MIEQYAAENNHLMRYCLTIHKSRAKICPALQVLTFHFSQVDDLLDEHSQKCAKKKMFQLQSLYNAKIFVQSGILVCLV